MIMSGLPELAARFLQGLGLAECPIEAVEERLLSYARGPTAKYRCVRITTDPGDALEFLSTLTWPATRHVLFANRRTLTALINNGRNGSDYADDVYHLPRHLNCRFARMLNCPHRVWRRGKLREVQQYGARIFDLHDADGETIRSISCANDGGRWDFNSFGTAHPAETPIDNSLRPSERFPSEQLIATAAAFGFPLPTVEEFLGAGRFVLMTQDLAQPIGTCTIAEADDPAYSYFLRGMGYVRFMKTHAASVVADFERCLEINPDYEPRVRDHLQEARQRLR